MTSRSNGIICEICLGPRWVAGPAIGTVRRGGQWEEPSPVHHRVSIEGHEENLAATS